METACLARLLALAGGPEGRWLDMPSGAGRLAALLPGPPCCCDLSLEMLRLCPDRRRRVRADALALPFADGAFDGVLCMRLLPHLAKEQRLRALAELARVSRAWVLVSFFHSFSLQHLRRSLRRRFLGRRAGRNAVSFRRFRAEAAQAGLEVAAVLPLARLVSEQWLALLRAPGPDPGRSRAPGSARPPGS